MPSISSTRLGVISPANTASYHAFVPRQPSQCDRMLGEIRYAVPLYQKARSCINIIILAWAEAIDAWVCRAWDEVKCSPEKLIRMKCDHRNEMASFKIRVGIKQILGVFTDVGMIDAILARVNLHSTVPIIAPREKPFRSRRKPLYFAMTVIFTNKSKQAHDLELIAWRYFLSAVSAWFRRAMGKGETCGTRLATTIEDYKTQTAL